MTTRAVTMPGQRRPRHSTTETRRTFVDFLRDELGLNRHHVVCANTAFVAPALVARWRAGPCGGGVSHCWPSRGRCHRRDDRLSGHAGGAVTLKQSFRYSH